MPPRPHSRRGRTRPRVVGALLASLGLLLSLLALAPPAMAGQVGVTIGIQGAGRVDVVEGSLEDNGSTVCDFTTNSDHRVTHWCSRVRNSEPFEAWVWLRPTPAAAPRGAWRFDGWEGCDQTRETKGVTECAVHSGAFSSDERKPLARFRDVQPPVISNLRLTQVPETQGTFRVDFEYDGIYAECRLDEQAYAPCEPGKVISAPAGAHEYWVRTEDMSGNVSATSLMFRAVETQLLTAPPKEWNSSEVRFTFRTIGGSEFLCRLDGADLKPCGAGPDGVMAYGGLSDGWHTFEVTSRHFGWVDQTSATYSFVVDTSAPEAVLERHVIDGTSARFEWHATGAVRHDCRLTLGLTEGRWTRCDSPMVYTGLPDGQHRFEVRSTDTAGNQQQVPTSHAWIVDAGAPETTLTGGPADRGWLLDRTARFTLGASEAGTLSCTLDGRARPCAPGALTLPGLTSGTHLLTATATDGRGNVDASPATRSWTVPHLAAELRQRKKWTTKRSARAYGGSYVTTRRKGAALTRRVTGARRIALVAGGGRRHGTVRVYAGKRLLGTVRLAGRATSRRLVVLPALAAPYTGPVRVVVTSKKRPVRIEGLGVATR
ncbi:hypothetical protein [Nocardioides sp. SYSU D00038]|uniref:hypothetical protein n=1 Tax=Nocardioides sp. SYSU D00038 TaxID=2812554 RepID=UPI0019671960|nr:hypothetical protein [Nocardioides sp. SYSU D00038]